MTLRRINKFLCYLILILLSILCLFSFYLLIINSTRAHSQIQKGFSFTTGDFFVANLKNVLGNSELPIVKGIRNSLIVSILSALLATYFSVLTAFSIHIYDFKLKKLAFTFIMMVMMIPPQVSALGFVRWMGGSI